MHDEQERPAATQSDGNHVRWVRGVGSLAIAVAITMSMTAAVQRSATHQVSASRLAAVAADTNPPPVATTPSRDPAAKRPKATPQSRSTNMAWTHFQKPSDAELQSKLTPVEYQVTQHEGTEPSFHNQYWDNHEDGIYVDIVSGEPLFSSTDKFESGTGWPSFTKPLDAANVVTRSDKSLFMARTEVRSKHADSHLGHVFDDGPEPTGLRYCMNSAAMRFIPVDSLASEGYGQYLSLFKTAAKK